MRFRSRHKLLRLLALGRGRLRHEFLCGRRRCRSFDRSGTGCNSDFPVPQVYKYRNYVIDSFNKEVEANPNYRRARYYEAQAYRSLNRNADALQQ